MIKKNNSYDKYKEIYGYGYINKIPNEWEKLPNIAIFDERISKGHLNEELISVTISRGIIKQSEIENKKDTSNEDKTNYKLVKQGDLAYNKMRMWQGAIGFSKYRGIVSPAYIVLKPKININSEYFHYLFRTNYYKNYAKRFSYGLCDDQLNLRYSDFKRMYSIVPPIETQNIIVEYLNRKSNKAIIFIEKQLKIIELLKEEKKAYINKAITKGVNRNIRLKDSGIEWLGEIPEHWKISKIKYVATINPPKSNSRFTKNSLDVVTFLPMEAVNESGEINLDNKKAVKELWEGFTFFAKNDVVIAKITPCFENGKGAYLNKLDTEIGFGTTEFHVLRANKNINPEFLYFITRSNNFKKMGEENMVGTAGQKRVPVEFISNYPIAIPNLKEQQEIIDYLKIQIKKIDTMIEQAKKEIKLTQNYLESIIFHVVTGQLKVK
ncbi:restriction endonuclease subunit S [Clostridium botulinum]|uniref:restriction endonuclease subunit S n=1 Tax=Clostridium botulinum TaxID=1491 RepID=UPI000A175273|nr:restriction endonuclease subunit S [Clostridium botulinum]MBN3409347.1 restriction endonuclease subunit S [Clostridium botulinum]MBY6795628.1 restriction endonuclease subunit S [Clostridium botulinum]MBY6865441.1 restriction endonuclease subunit S [Clostridium botulinum]MBY6888130.1 restriction endonuclease subunit S [Clostridium botulinum]MCC5422535.1 restriction endonuclease subunit S [Clostridium botulinum]